MHITFVSLIQLCSCFHKMRKSIQFILYHPAIHKDGQISMKNFFPVIIWQFSFCYPHVISIRFVQACVTGSTKLTGWFTVKCLYPLCCLKNNTNLMV